MNFIRSTEAFIACSQWFSELEASIFLRPYFETMGRIKINIRNKNVTVLMILFCCRHFLGFHQGAKYLDIILYR